MKYLHNTVVGSLFLIIIVGGASTLLGQSSANCNLRPLLATYLPLSSSSLELSTVFKSGDECIPELIKLLKDSDAQIRLNTQQAIRYLGNPDGLAAMHAERRGEPPIIDLPVAVPLVESDFNLIESAYKSDFSLANPQYEGYLFALAFDGSERAKRLFETVSSKEKTSNKHFKAAKYVSTAQVRIKVDDEKKLAELVLLNSPFLDSAQRKAARATLLAFNAKGDKALIEVFINWGPLATMQYFVVVEKKGSTWKFFSVTLISVS